MELAAFSPLVFTIYIPLAILYQRLIVLICLISFHSPITLYCFKTFCSLIQYIFLYPDILNSSLSYFLQFFILELLCFFLPIFPSFPKPSLFTLLNEPFNTQYFLIAYPSNRHIYQLIIYRFFFYTYICNSSNTLRRIHQGGYIPNIVFSLNPYIVSSQGAR